MQNFTSEEVGFLIVAFGQFCDGGFTKEGWGRMRAIQTKLAEWHEWSLMSELESAAREVYKYAKIAVNQIICVGGEETCQPCENRESLAIALGELERVFERHNTGSSGQVTAQASFLSDDSAVTCR